MKVHFSQMTNALNWSPTPGCRKASEQWGEHTGWPHERTPHSGPPPGALRSDSRFLVFKRSPPGRKHRCEGQVGCTGNSAPARFFPEPASRPYTHRGLGDVARGHRRKPLPSPPSRGMAGGVAPSLSGAGCDKGSSPGARGLSGAHGNVLIPFTIRRQGKELLRQKNTV